MSAAVAAAAGAAVLVVWLTVGAPEAALTAAFLLILWAVRRPRR